MKQNLQNTTVASQQLILIVRVFLRHKVNKLKMGCRVKGREREEEEEGEGERERGRGRDGF